MQTATALYVGLVTLLLLVALGASVPVLVRMVREGRERWRDDDATGPHPEPEDDEPGDEDGQPCPHCGTGNDPAFTYCRRCGESL